MNIGWTILIIITTVLSTLKITGQIATSWIWVISPLWIPFCIGMIFSIIIIAMFFQSKEWKNYKIRKKHKKY